MATNTKVRPPGWVEPEPQYRYVRGIQTPSTYRPVTVHCATADNGRCYADVLDLAAHLRQEGDWDAADWLAEVSGRHFRDLKQGRFGQFSGSP